MALITDDIDIRNVQMQTAVGNNGDYYLSLFEYPKTEFQKFKCIHYRMSMSGGFASHHPKVREAFVSLYRAMQEAGMNEPPQIN
jgi:hypothetical protein